MHEFQLRPRSSCVHECVAQQLLSKSRAMSTLLSAYISTYLCRSLTRALYLHSAEYKVLLREVARGVTQERNEKHPAWNGYHTIYQVSRTIGKDTGCAGVLDVDG